MSAPSVPVAWNVTGGKSLPAGNTPDATYWRRHLREPVRFADGIASLKAQGVHSFPGSRSASDAGGVGGAFFARGQCASRRFSAPEQGRLVRDPRRARTDACAWRGCAVEGGECRQRRARLRVADISVRTSRVLASACRWRGTLPVAGTSAGRCVASAAAADGSDRVSDDADAGVAVVLVTALRPRCRARGRPCVPRAGAARRARSVTRCVAPGRRLHSARGARTAFCRSCHRASALRKNRSRSTVTIRRTRMPGGRCMRAAASCPSLRSMLAPPRWK